jgi:GNAT superfamily N-acetyltransferase
MSKITIRELRPYDMPKLLNLMATRDELDFEGAKKRKQLMEWCAFRNPYANNEPTYFVAEDNGEIVAHLGRMPTEFMINGKHQKGYFVHDLYVHPENRKRGTGFFLSMSLYKAIEQKSDSFLCLIWTSDLNLAMQRRRGYYELKAGCYLKIINPDEILKRVLKQKTLASVLGPFIKVVLDLMDFIILGLISSHREIIAMDRFDSRFDNFYQSILSKIGMCSYKQSSYLNWKLIDRPSSNIVALAAQEKGQLKGVVVLARHLGKEYPEGMIVDIIADPQDTRTIVSLLKEAIIHFRRERLFSIRCCMTDRRIIKVLRRFLFLSLPRGEPVMLANLEKIEQKDMLMDINNWNFTYSESDEIMLRPNPLA